MAPAVWVRQVHRWSKWPGSTALSDEADSRPMKGSQDLDGFHNVTRSGEHASRPPLCGDLRSKTKWKPYWCQTQNIHHDNMKVSMKIPPKPMDFNAKIVYSWMIWGTSISGNPEKSPSVIKHGWLENPPFSSRISQLATFDDRRVYYTILPAMAAIAFLFQIAWD